MFIEIEYKNGEKEIVTIDEAEELKRKGLLKVFSHKTETLTPQDVFGIDYEQ